MKFIARHLNLIGVLMLAAFGAAAAGLYFQTPRYESTVKAKAAAAGDYVCPMHPQVKSAVAGDCPECGMKLVEAKTLGPNQTGAPEGCCGAKLAAPEPPLACPHLAAQAAKAEPASHQDGCCSKPIQP